MVCAALLTAGAVAMLAFTSRQRDAGPSRPPPVATSRPEPMTPQPSTSSGRPTNASAGHQSADRPVTTPLSREESDAWAKRIHDAGGSVEVDVSGQVYQVSLPPACELDSELPFLMQKPHICWLRIINASDATVARLESMPALSYLNIVGVPITDAAFAHVDRWPLLNDIGLIETKVTDEGIRRIMNAPRVVSIILRRQPITDQTLKPLERPGGPSIALMDTTVPDAALASLSLMPDMEDVQLPGCKFSAAGLAHVAKMPKLKLVAAFNCQGFVMTVDGLSTRVETIYLNGKPVNDTSLAYLAKFEELCSLTVTGGVITDAGWRRWRTAAS